MNCQACRGACCETFFVRDIDLNLPSMDVRHWVRLHTISVENGWYEFNTPCSALTSEGACGIYEDRPQLCRDYLAGGTFCMDAVHARRTRTQYDEIREHDDPPWQEPHGANALP